MNKTIEKRQIFVLYMPEWMVQGFKEGVESINYHNRIIKKGIASLLFSCIEATYHPEDNLYYYAKDGELFILEPDWVVENN